MPILIAIGGLIASAVTQMFAFFARQTAWNIALAVALTVGVGAALTTLINVIGGYLGTLATQTDNVPFIPYFLPSNLGYCLGAVVAVKVAGTIYNGVVNYIENKSYILKS